jgi:hypothetical protein
LGPAAVRAVLSLRFSPGARSRFAAIISWHGYDRLFKCINHVLNSRQIIKTAYRVILP